MAKCAVSRRSGAFVSPPSRGADQVPATQEGGAVGQLVAHSVLVSPTVQAPPVLELEELLLEELELDEELLEELELDELLLEELLDELELELELELEDELELLEEPEPPLIVPADAVRITLSSLDPSSLLRIRSV